MPFLPSTPRPSIPEKLEDLYRNVNAASPTGIRSQIVNRQGIMAWGLSKTAGSPSYAAVNYINATPMGFNGNDWAQREFQPFATQGVTRFTGDFSGNVGGLGYAKVGLGHNSTRYWH